MNAFALHAPTEKTGLRWALSAAAIVALYGGLIAAGFGWYRQPPPTGTEMPAIMIDMAPSSAAPEIQPMDVAPGPDMQQADEPTPPPTPPPPEPVQQAPVEEQIAPTPPMEKPEVEAPPEQKAEPTPPPPEPAKVVPEPPKVKPEPIKPKPVRPQVKKPSDTPPAPRTSAAPRAERQGRAAAAATAGAAAAAAALPAYRDRLAAHLQRYKQYPAGAKSAGRQGVAMLSFTVGRNGQVLASRLAGSSGVGELDAETMAMIRRAQPLPAFPPEMTQGSLSFTVPVRFSIR